MAAQGNFVKGPYNPQADLINANGTAIQSAITAPAGGCILKNIKVSSDDTSQRVVQIYYNDAPAFQLTIPANAGSTAAAIDMFSNPYFTNFPVDALGNKYWQLSASDTIKWAAVTTAVTATKKIMLRTTIGGNFQ